MSWHLADIPTAPAFIRSWMPAQPVDATQALADKPSRAKIRRRPLLSKSGQTRAQLECPLSAMTFRLTPASIERRPMRSLRRSQSLIGCTKPQSGPRTFLDDDNDHLHKCDN